MGQRIGGVLNFTIDGQQYAARGNFEVVPSTVKREGVAGQDFVHGYTEMPIVPSIKGDLTTVPGLENAALLHALGSTAMVCLEGAVFILRGISGLHLFEQGESRLGIRLQGAACDEL